MGDFYKKLIIILLFAIPAGYVSMFISLGSHEIIGHGLTSEILGGDFTKLVLRVDGFGTAYSENMDDFDNFDKFLWLFSGIFWTTILGIVFLVLAFVFSEKLFTSLTFLLISMTMFLDGAPYMFWNSLRAVRPGDIGKILVMYPGLRWPFFIIGGLIMLLGIIVLNILLFRVIENYLSQGKGLEIKKKVIVLSIIFLIQASAWFIFDWNLLVPGINQIPNIIAAILIAGTLIYLGIKKQKYGFGYDDKRWKSWVVGAGMIFIILLASILIWFQQGYVF